MRVFRTDGSGRVDGIVVQDLPVPEPGHRQALVRMRAFSLNYLDIKVIAGDFPGGARGLVPLSDGAGEVVSVGPGVTQLAAGDRVVSTFFPLWQAGQITDAARRVLPGSTCDGVLQDYVLFEESALVPIPEGLTYDEAATLPCAAVTGWQLLTGSRPVLPGEIVVVQGSGGVSLFALQFARLAGARVIATSSSPAKAEKLKALGAEAVIDYRAQPSWGHEVKRMTGGQGADHLIEIGEPGTLQQTIAAAAVGAQINLVGRPVGAPPVDPSVLMAAMAVTYRRIGVGSRSDFLAMMRAIETHRLAPVIDRRFKLSELKQALAYFAGRGQFGKVVICNDDERAGEGAQRRRDR